ncbi:MAG: Gfo/Idh/MocA family oxidoreductase [Verrucomicrobia bacterium]|nr:Gfo/Idh/MocA family oxidoreductase [Verrucomicrobiota bacterium]MDA1066130.1 Gfo/Idh/MocA family oxidoreductase [Verrucomicrobiota bacterium]
MIRIGIVGCGRILAAHLRGYRLLREAGFDNFRITALCARKTEDAQMYAKRGEGPPQRPAVSDSPGDPLAIDDEYVSDFQDDVDVALYDNYDEMITRGPVDAINDFTSHGMHHLVAEVACRAGKHLLTQKPLAVTVAAARKMCEDFETAALTLGVFENVRFLDKARYLRWLIDSGYIGTPQMFLLGNVGNWWTPDKVVAHTPWRHFKKLAGGIALDLGVHQFHLARYLLGDLNSIAGTAQVIESKRHFINTAGESETIDCDADDIFNATFTSASGAFGSLTASWAGHGEGIHFGGGPVLYGSKGRVMGDALTLDDGSTHPIEMLYQDQCDPERKDREFPRGITNAFATAQLDWINAIQEKRPTETSGREGLTDLAAAFAILESDLAGRRISIEEVINGTVSEYQVPIAEYYNLHTKMQELL